MPRLASKKTSAATNWQHIAFGPHETVLAAALRGGSTIPFNCRVGGRGACRCKLCSVRIKELIETGHILTADEVGRGFILACQSVPEIDCRIDVAKVSPPVLRITNARVIAQLRPTYDITAPDVQFDQNLPYKAGQHTRLSISGLPGIVRNHSFSSRTRPDGRTSFFVHKVEQGSFSVEFFRARTGLADSWRGLGAHQLFIER